MTKEQLFKKYFIDETHSEWNNRIDNHMSIEVYRIMHDGNLPPREDMSTKWVVDFLDKIKGDSQFISKIRRRNDFGSLYLTSKRMAYSLYEQILKEING